MGYLPSKFSQLQLCRSSDEINTIKVKKKYFGKLKTSQTNVCSILHQEISKFVSYFSLGINPCEG